MYRDKRFRMRPIKEIIEDLDMAVKVYGNGVRTIFLADGNSAVLSTNRLVAIGKAAKERFPNLDRITVYGSAKFLGKKSKAEWQEIAKAGIKRIHSGLESGDPVTLENLCKGITPEEAVTAYTHVLDAGIELSVYLMIGVAGIERWREHALGSAAVLNQASPHYVRLRTYVPMPDTPWYECWHKGYLTLPSAYEALQETRLLIENLDGPTRLLSDHVSNFLDMHGVLPEDRNVMLGTLDKALTWPLSRFRPPTENLVGLGL
jgi:radical SAM superfamily enzyme YgiQ (UPF0313 family)